MRIAIVGFGPKGLYGLERLLAHYHHQDLNLEMEVHMFNKNANFGTGDNYAPDQPAYLLMNYENSKISMWPGNSVSPIVPKPQTYSEWLQSFPGLDFSSEYDISPRSKVGEYLLEGLEHLKKSCPESVHLFFHQGEVVDINQTDQAYAIRYIAKDGNPVDVDNIHFLLITTGHPWGVDKSKMVNSQTISEIYPVEPCLQHVSAKTQVLIQGMGLTFIDAVLALTEGRGGTFEINSGKWTYRPSGQEPSRIIPCSRSGLLPFPKSPEPSKKNLVLRYFRPEKLQEFLDENLPINFGKTILPLLEQEYKWQYYQVLFERHGQHLSFHGDFARVQKQIDQFHDRHPQFNRFDFLRFLKEPFVTEGKVRTQSDLLSSHIQEAEEGSWISPLATVAVLWRIMAPHFEKIYSFGGLDPESHQQFDLQFFGALNRVSFGPPLVNLKKLQAISVSGILDLSGGFGYGDKSLNNKELEELEKECDWIIYAQVPRYQVDKSPGELYGNMIRNGLIVPYQNRDAMGNSYAPGCPHIHRKGHPINKKGEVNSRITFMGTPTEGITLDNDSLSREKNDFLEGWAKNLCQELKNLNVKSAERISLGATGFL